MILGSYARLWGTGSRAVETDESYRTLPLPIMLASLTDLLPHMHVPSEAT